MSDKEQYEAWKQERMKERVLDLIDKKGTIDVSRVSDILGEPMKEVSPILVHLKDEKLIRSDVGNYYHLTFEGERRIRSIRERERERSKTQTRKAGEK